MEPHSAPESLSSLFPHLQGSSWLPFSSHLHRQCRTMVSPGTAASLYATLTGSTLTTRLKPSRSLSTLFPACPFFNHLERPDDLSLGFLSGAAFCFTFPTQIPRSSISTVFVLQSLDCNGSAKHSPRKVSTCTRNAEHSWVGQGGVITRPVWPSSVHQSSKSALLFPCSSKLDEWMHGCRHG